MSDPTSQENPKFELSKWRQRYKPVRETVIEQVKEAFDRKPGRPKSDIRTLREGSFHTAEKLHGEAYIDDLTNLPRRKPFEENTKKQMEEVNRNPDAHTLAFSFFDVDDYGIFNKKYGEKVGDDVLSMVGKTLKDSIRQIDNPGRWGGEEIAFSQLYAKNEDSHIINGVERVRQNIGMIDIPIKGGQIQEHVTASFGSTEYAPGESFEETMERAGIGMRLAKLFGKNRTVGVTLRTDGRLDVTDYQTGNTYIYESEVTSSETNPEENEIKEYLTDLTEQTKTRVVRDETGRKYRIKIENVYDEENPMPNPNVGK